MLARGYSAQCTVRGCRARADKIARYTDGQGRPAETARDSAIDTGPGSRRIARTQRAVPMPERPVKTRLNSECPPVNGCRAKNEHRYAVSPANSPHFSPFPPLLVSLAS